MKKFDEWVLPDHEEHLQKWMVDTDKRVNGRLTYQYHKYEAALKFCKQRRLAIDVGAHVGLWSYFMARDFEDLAAFEPVELHRQCWQENLKFFDNAELYPYALGVERGKVAMTTDEFSTGNTRVQDDMNVCAKYNIEMYPLDEFNFPYVDFIKIDCEGYELNVLRGAHKLITKHKPCIIVEQKGSMGERYGSGPQQAVRYLEHLGATVRGATGGDYILSWV